jgi:hypothetical protein
MSDSLCFAAQRTKGYRQNILKACITVRDMYLVANGTEPAGARAISQVFYFYFLFLFPRPLFCFKLVSLRRLAVWPQDV